jgi:hypothetical protein
VWFSGKSTGFVELSLMVTLNQYAAQLAALHGTEASGAARIELRPGMDFGAREKWWGAGGKRVRPHEGVDIQCFTDGGRNRHVLGAGGKVPALLSGEIIAICDDFLGQSVFVRGRDPFLGEIVAVHAHILPPGRVGDRIAGGAQIGVVAAGRGVVPPHLHLSLLRLPPGFSPGDLRWDILNQCGAGLFLAPFAGSCGMPK